MIVNPNDRSEVISIIVHSNENGDIDKMQEILQRLKKERAKYGERVEIEIRS